MQAIQTNYVPQVVPPVTWEPEPYIATIEYIFRDRHSMFRRFQFATYGECVRHIYGLYCMFVNKENQPQKIREYAEKRLYGMLFNEMQKYEPMNNGVRFRSYIE